MHKYNYTPSFVLVWNVVCRPEEIEFIAFVIEQGTQKDISV
jgi:hypothetical protein